MQITAEKNQTNLNMPRLTRSMRYARLVMGFSLLLSDILSLLLAFGLSSLLRIKLLGNIGSVTLYLIIFPILLILILVFAWQGLYKNGGITQIQELRIVFESTSIVYLLTTTITFLLQNSQIYSRFIFISAWISSIMLLPLLRWMVRSVMIQKNLWGEPIAIIGAGPKSMQLALSLHKEPLIGFKPFILIGGKESHSPPQNDFPVYQTNQFEDVITKIKCFSLHTILVVQSEIPSSWVQKFNDAITQQIPKLIFVLDKDLTPGITVKAYDLGGALGLETHHDLLIPWGQVFKRLLDLAIVTVSGFLLLPVLLIIGILIKLDSSGSIFYGQIRVGKQGKRFQMWKFRTMVQNADQVLEEYLKNDQKLREKWDIHQKLRDDPRITRVGKWLRVLSLDELPQLINVIRGEMSIVGPRPFMPEQADEYGDVLELYKCTSPGITGLWQVSGRNNTTYQERVRMDGYYVRNWTIWLDIYILLKTIPVIISRDGAF